MATEPNSNISQDAKDKHKKLKLVLPGLKPLKRFMNGNQYDSSSAELQVTIDYNQVVVDMTARTSGKQYHITRTNRDFDFPSIDDKKSNFEVKDGRMTVYVYPGN